MCSVPQIGVSNNISTCIIIALYSQFSTREHLYQWTNPNLFKSMDLNTIWTWTGPYLFLEKGCSLPLYPDNNDLQWVWHHVRRRINETILEGIQHYWLGIRRMPSKTQGHYSYAQHPQITQKLPLGTELLMLRQRFLSNIVLHSVKNELSWVE